MCRVRACLAVDIRLSEKLVKTRYRFIHFQQEGDYWLCYTNRSPRDCLGVVEYFTPWKQWQIAPKVNTAFTSDCLADIIHFMGQLPKL